MDGKFNEYGFVTNGFIHSNSGLLVDFPCYFYTASDAKLIQKGIDSGCGTDAPGSYIAWLCTQVTVHAMEMPGKRYDIGNLESYEKVKSEYKGITNY